MDGWGKRRDIWISRIELNGIKNVEEREQGELITCWVGIRIYWKNWLWSWAQSPELKSQYGTYQMYSSKHRECINYPRENYSAEGLCATNSRNHYYVAKCRVFHVLKSRALIWGTSPNSSFYHLNTLGF